MDMHTDPMQPIRLTAYEVALISRPMALDLGVLDDPKPVEVPPQVVDGETGSRSLLRFFWGAMAIHTLIVCVQTVLDLEHLGRDFLAQFFHYATTYFWPNLSGAMLVAAWVVLEPARLRAPKYPSASS